MLRDRVITALVLIGALLGALFFLPITGWALFIGVALYCAGWEWAGLAGYSRAQQIGFGAVLTVAGLGWVYATGMLGEATALGPVSLVYLLATVFWVVCAPLWLRQPARKRSGWLLLLVGAVVLLPSYAALIHLRDVHPVTLLLFLATVWIADIAAYFAGRRFGRRKLAPAISPGKTWAGVYGAFGATTVYAALWIVLLPQFVPSGIDGLPGGRIWMFVCIAALTAVAILGDLFESALKRQAGVKDSSQLLPGHGGVLDRVDALLPVLPLAALVVSL